MFAFTGLMLDLTFPNKDIVMSLNNTLNMRSMLANQKNLLKEVGGCSWEIYYEQDVALRRMLKLIRPGGGFRGQI
jgi:hypothetical protein